MDGYNVIGRDPGLSRLMAEDRDEGARDAVVAACRSFAVRRRCRVILVFDGQAGHGRPLPSASAVEVVYATGPGRADAHIVALANRLIGEARPVTVVTDDRGIRRELLRGVGSMGAGDFWALASDPQPSRGRRARGARASSAGGGAEEKPAPGSMPDIDRHFLEAEAARHKPPRKPKPSKS